MAVPIRAQPTATRRASAKKPNPAPDADPTVIAASVVVVGTAAELDYVPADVELLQKTWDLIESGSAKAPVHGPALTLHRIESRKTLSQPAAAPLVEITLDAAVMAVPAAEPLTLHNLGLSSNHFLFVDGAFVKTNRDGETCVEPTQGMRVQTERYPELQPIAWVYWMWGNHMPDRKQIARALQSPWGRTLLNGFNSLLLSFLARPGISFSPPSPSPAELILTVISSGKMLDLMLKETILRLLTDATLETGHVLVSLFFFELCLVVAAGVDLWACARLPEYHAVPALLVAWLVVKPALHAAWVAAAAAVPAVRRRGMLVGCVTMLVPLAVLVAAVVADVSWRAGVQVDGLRTCRVLRTPGAESLHAVRKERVML